MKKFSQESHDQFLKDIKEKMIDKTIPIDSALFDINNMFFDKAFCDGGDDLISEFDANRFVYQMTIRLTDGDIVFWDSNIDDLDEIDLKLYCKKRDEILELINSGQLEIK